MGYPDAWTPGRPCAARHGRPNLACGEATETFHAPSADCGRARIARRHYLLLLFLFFFLVFFVFFSFVFSFVIFVAVLVNFVTCEVRVLS